jgi:hypothetical protein
MDERVNFVNMDIIEGHSQSFTSKEYKIIVILFHWTVRFIFLF